MFVLAGGAVHLREWLETYRDVPAAVPGSAVVRVGFLVHAATSVVLAVAIAVVAARARFGRWWVRGVALAAIGLQLSSLAALFLSRTDGGFLRWMEEGWSTGATQTLAIEVAAVALLALWATRAARPTPAGATAAPNVGPPATATARAA